MTQNPNESGSGFSHAALEFSKNTRRKAICAAKLTANHPGVPLIVGMVAFAATISSCAPGFFAGLVSGAAIAKLMSATAAQTAIYEQWGATAGALASIYAYRNEVAEGMRQAIRDNDCIIGKYFPPNPKP
ncbi:MAG: hypothetical protein PHE27_03935 [Alphaproteobacteria bacterium]|nr:hypothetical protein [Alphaproteobacteria bacterium]